MNKRMIPSGLLAAAMMVAANGANAVELTLLIDNRPETVTAYEALTAAYTAQNPDITFDIEARPGGGEGDNIVKTRLATEEMTDIFSYNSGSLFQAIKPERNLEPLTDLPNMSNVIDSFKATVTAGGDVYGVPNGAAMGGGIFYNVKIYEELGLSIPKSWDEFMANNAAIKAAGKVAVAQTYKDTWTSQLFVLADYFNVNAIEPDFAERYTNNQAKYATSEAARKGFERLQETYEAGYFNADFGAATYPDGVRMVSTGEAAHYPMLTFAISGINQDYPDYIDDVGFFAQPGDSADSNGLTVWMPGGTYVYRHGDNVAEAKDFVNWLATAEACQIQIDAEGASGPYLISGCELPNDVPRAVSDMIPYFETAGATAPALEFLSPIKGPALEQITVEVGSGIRSAADAAALYDQDVEKQARQLGLDNW